MEHSTLKFGTLTELAQFVQMISPAGYTINTMELTLWARISPFEKAIAVEKYRATQLIIKPFKQKEVS